MTIQIQGSARVRLEDGTMLRLNYDAHNGHSYTAVGRILIERGLVPREEMSMDRIRQWMAKNPDQAKEVRGTNKSFVFFRITGLNADDEPSGAQGVPLTPGRSIAVDRIHVYGTPFFIDAELPIDGARTNDQFRRLMVSQDTGSAIIGPARADLYFGAGDDAGAIAGRIRQQGRFVMLLPRELDMVEAGRAMPLPRPKPEAGRSDRSGRSQAKSKADAKAKPKADGQATRRRRRNEPEAKSKLKQTNVLSGGRDDPATAGQRRGAGAVARRHAHGRRRCKRPSQAAPSRQPMPTNRSRSRRGTSAPPHPVAAAPKSVPKAEPRQRRRRWRRSTAARSSGSRAARRRSTRGSTCTAARRARRMPRCCASCTGRRPTARRPCW